jgi:hypothetical protein
MYEGEVILHTGVLLDLLNVSTFSSDSDIAVLKTRRILTFPNISNFAALSHSCSLGIPVGNQNRFYEIHIHVRETFRILEVSFGLFPLCGSKLYLFRSTKLRPGV